MIDLPIVTTPYVVSEILKEFMQEVNGTNPSYAEVLAQLHIRASRVLPNWGNFLLDHCTSCEFSPSNCRFLNPTEADCTGSATPAEIYVANRSAISKGKLLKCPVFSRIRSSTAKNTAEGESNEPAECPDNRAGCK